MHLGRQVSATELGPRYQADRRHAPYKESRICFSCDPVNQWVMRKDIPGEPSIRYGKLLTGLTGHRKPRKMARIQAFCAWRDPGSNPRGGCVWGENVEPGGSGSPFVSSHRHLVNSVDGVR